MQKSNSGNATVATTIETSKNSIRSHQILSRETSFISKPITTIDEKDESIKNIAIQSTTTSSQLTTPIIGSESSIAPSTMTVTGKVSMKKHFFVREMMCK